MLDAIWEALSGIVEFFQNVWSYISSFFVNLGTLFTSIGDAVVDAYTIVYTFVPTILIPLVGTMILIIVLLRILGRD